MIKNKWKNFIVFYMFSYVLLYLLSIFMIKIATEQELNIQIFANKNLYFLIGVYLLLISLIFTLLLYSIFHFINRKQERKVEEALKLLNKGQYSGSIFLKMFSEETEVQITPIIDKEFLKLHKKLMFISEEAISLTQQATSLSKETKEEILEEERHRIARELHDSVSQQLFAAAMLLSTIQAIKQDLPESIQNQLQMINSIVGEAQSEMRALLLHLRPIKLSGRTLKSGIEQLLKELESKVPIQITYEIEELKLPEAVEDHLFRIVQELLSNVLRHSHAKELEVFLKEKKDFYQLKVIDDGKGFDMDKNLNKGLGLSNIKERITGLGGTVRIISFPNEGTSVELKIPLITKG